MVGELSADKPHPRSLSPHVAPINNLPPEILVYIIDLAIQFWREVHYRLDEIEKEPDILASVCVHWRKLMLGNPTFWSHIYIVHGNHDSRMSIAQAKSWMERAGSIPLDIHITNAGLKRNLGEEEALTDLLESTSNHRLGSLTFDLHGWGEGEDVILNRYLCNWGPGTLTKLVIDAFRLDFPGRFIKSATNQIPSLGNEMLVNLPHDQLEALWGPVKILRLRGFYIRWESHAYHGLVELCLFSDYLDRVDPPIISESQLEAILASSPGLQVIRFGLTVEEDIIQGSLVRRKVASIKLDHLQILDLNVQRPHTGSAGIGGTLRCILHMISPASRPFELLLPRFFDPDIALQNRREVLDFVARSRVLHLGISTQSPTLDWLLPSVPHLQTLVIRSHFVDPETMDLECKGENNSSILSKTVNKVYILHSRVVMSVFRQWLSRYPRVRMLEFWKCSFYSGHKCIPWSSVDGELKRSGLLNNCSEVKIIPDDRNPIPGWNIPRYDHSSKPGETGSFFR